MIELNQFTLFFFPTVAQNEAQDKFEGCDFSLFSNIDDVDVVRQAGFVAPDISLLGRDIFERVTY